MAASLDIIVARISGLDKDIEQIRKEIKEKEEKLEAPDISDNAKKFDFFAKRVNQLNATLQSLQQERSELTRQQGQLLLVETDEKAPGTKKPATLVDRAREALRKFTAEDLIQLREDRDNRGDPNVHREPDASLDFVGRTQEQVELQEALTPAFTAERDDKKTKVIAEYATISGAGKSRWLFQAFKTWSHIKDDTQLTSSVVHLDFNGADGSNDCLETKKPTVQPEAALARLLLSRGLLECAPDLTWIGRGPVPDAELPPVSVIADALFKSLFVEGKGLLVVHLDELYILVTKRIDVMAKLYEAQNQEEKDAKALAEAKARAKALAEAEVFTWITTFLGQICGLSDHTKSRYVVPIITHTSPSGRIIGPDSLSSLAYKPLKLYPLTMDQSWELLNAARRQRFRQRRDWQDIEGRIVLDGTFREMWTPCVALAGGHPSLLLDSFKVITGTLDPAYNQETRGHATGQLVTNHRVEEDVDWDRIEDEVAKTFVGKALRMEEIGDEDTEFDSIFNQGCAWYLPKGPSERRRGYVSAPFPYLLKLMEKAGGVYRILARQLNPKKVGFEATKAMEYVAALAVMLNEDCDPATWVETDIASVKNGQAVLTTESEKRPFMSVWPSSIEPATDFGGKFRTAEGFTGILGQVKMQLAGGDTTQGPNEVMEFAWFIGNQVATRKLNLPVNAYFVSSRKPPNSLANLVFAFRVAMSGCVSMEDVEREAKKFKEEERRRKSTKGESTETSETKSKADRKVDVCIVIRYLATSGKYELNPDYQFTYVGKGLGEPQEGCAEMSSLLPKGVFAGWYS